MFKKIWPICAFLIMGGWLTACGDGGGGGAWSAPQMIGPNVSISPDIAADQDGNALAVFGGLSGFWSNQYVAGHGWKSAALADVVPNGLIIQEPPPRILSGLPNGEAVSVWQSGGGLLSAHYSSGSGWEPLVRIDNNQTQLILSRDSRAGLDGTVLVAWTQGDIQNNLVVNYSVVVTAYVPGIGWGTPAVVVNNLDSVFALHVGVDQDGNGLVVWTQTSGAQGSVWAVRYVAGSGWTVPELVSSAGPGVPVFGSAMGMNDDGNALAAWFQSDGLWSNRFTPGSGWGTAEMIDPVFLGGVNDVTMDEHGNAIVLWSEAIVSGYGQIWAKRYDAGSGWLPNELIADGDVGIPRLAMNRGGEAVVVWSDPFGLYARRYQGAVGWEEAERVVGVHGFGAITPSYVTTGQVSLADNGAAFVVWEHFDAQSGSTVWASHTID